MKYFYLSCLKALLGESAVAKTLTLDEMCLSLLLYGDLEAPAATCQRSVKIQLGKSWDIINQMVMKMKAVG